MTAKSHTAFQMLRLTPIHCVDSDMAPMEGYYSAEIDNG